MTYPTNFPAILADENVKMKYEKIRDIESPDKD
jgi:hypothetical protein